MSALEEELYEDLNYEEAEGMFDLYGEESSIGNDGDRVLRLDATRSNKSVEEIYDDLAAEQVIPPDTRKRIVSTTRIPFRYICKLEIRRDGRDFICTGTLVGPNKVLTAAHCIIQPGSTASSVRAIPGKRDSGRHKRSEPLGSAMGTRVQFSRRHRIAGDAYDYAIITLASPIGNKVGWWRRIAAWSDAKVRSRKANTAGFPADRHLRGDRMYWAFNSFASVRGARLEYFHDTFGGQSGSPLWVRWRSYRTIIGVHSDRDDSATPVVANVGVHITPRILADIRRWIR